MVSTDTPLGTPEEERAARERLEALLEFAPAFIVSLNREGNIDFINRTLSHHDKKSVLGTSWLLYLPPERQTLLTAALKSAYDTGLTQTYETTSPGPDGAALWFESKIAPVRVGGQIVGAVMVAQEITERKRAEAELMAGRQMALLGTLAAGVAHEINTPIQFIGDSLQFLRDATRDLLGLFDQIHALRQAAVAGRPLEQAVSQAREAEAEADLPYLRQNIPPAFERCLAGLKRVSTIVRSLKEFAHPAQEEMRAADLNRIVETTLTIAAGEYKYVSELQTDFGELPPVMCHAGEIGQVVLNVVVNAAHAIGDVVAGTDRKGMITVRTRREGPMAVISISDTGAGIPENVRPRIFDPFFTTKEVGKGTGQGLAIASSTIRGRHQGELTFETTLGEGTTFFIRIPIVNHEAAKK